MSGALPDYEAALRLALQAVDPSVLARIGNEAVSLRESSGRVLAEPIIADRDLPPFNRAMMDGYALRAAEVQRDRAFPVIGEVPAGASGDIPVPVGSCVKIATGAPLPRDCDAVIQHELSDRKNPVRFSIDRIDAGNAVHPRGSDAKRGDTLIAAGTIIAAQHFGIAAAAGVLAPSVKRRPRACVITSGDEVVSMDVATTSLPPHQIRNSNGIMVSDQLSRFGANPIRAEHVPDQAAATIDAVARAIADCDLIITIGGVSAGERDHFPAAFDAAGVKRFLIGAAIQPGRPVVVGLAPNGAIIIALPGNPVSALACACLFAWPLIRAMLGLDSALPWRDIELAQPVKPNAHRRAFRPATVQRDGRAIVPLWAGSGDLAHTSATHGLIELPVQSESVAAGAHLRFLPWP